VLHDKRLGRSGWEGEILEIATPGRNGAAADRRAGEPRYEIRVKDAAVANADTVQRPPGRRPHAQKVRSVTFCARKPKRLRKINF
jgi:hypothetical protein